MPVHPTDPTRPAIASEPSSRRELGGPIAVLGASGRVGSLTVRAAARRGLRVRAVARASSRTPADLADLTGVAVHTAALDAGELRAALAGCSAVVSVVGVRYRGGSVLRGLEGPADVVPAAVRAVLAATAPHVPLVLLSALGAGDSWRTLPAPLRAFIGLTAMRSSYRGLTDAEDLLASSGRQHVVVRAVRLVDGPATGARVETAEQRPGRNPRLVRADLAELLVDLAAEAAALGGPGEPVTEHRRVLMATGPTPTRRQT